MEISYAKFLNQIKTKIETSPVHPQAKKLALKTFKDDEELAAMGYEDDITPDVIAEQYIDDALSAISWS
jgi:hypothetical protein